MPHTHPAYAVREALLAAGFTVHMPNTVRQMCSGYRDVWVVRASGRVDEVKRIAGSVHESVRVYDATGDDVLIVVRY